MTHDLREFSFLVDPYHIPKQTRIDESCGTFVLVIRIPPTGMFDHPIKIKQGTPLTLLSYYIFHQSGPVYRGWYTTVVPSWHRGNHKSLK